MRTGRPAQRRHPEIFSRQRQGPSPWCRSLRESSKGMSDAKGRAVLGMIALHRTAVQGDDEPDPAGIPAEIPSMSGPPD